MKIVRTKQELILRPSQGNGVEFQLIASTDIEVGLFTSLTPPYVEIKLPFLSLNLGWYDSELSKQMEEFFKNNE